MSNLFDYAHGELTGSAFWAWVLSALCTDTPLENSSQYKLAISFVEKIGLQDGCYGAVKTEVKFHSAGRADIVLYSTDYNNDRPLQNIALIIENKTWSTAWAEDVLEQVNKYWEAIEPKPQNAKRAVMTFRYDTEQLWANILNNETKHTKFLGLKAQLNLFDGIDSSNDIIKQYYEYLNALHEDHQKSIQQIKTVTNLVTLNDTEILNRHDTQWKLMSLLTDGLELEQYNGNSSGRPWTQAGFWAQGLRFFYRIDKQSSGYYLRFNHYFRSDEFSEECRKNFRNNELVQLIKASLGQCSNKDIYEIPNMRLSANECSLWYIWFENNQNTVSTVYGFISEFQPAFKKEMDSYLT